LTGRNVNGRSWRLDTAPPKINEDTISDAQLGLLTATPIIIAFAGTLRAMGVLSTVATVSAIGLSIAIAVVLFTTQ
jgi:hypothetical protein